MSTREAFLSISNNDAQTRLTFAARFIFNSYYTLCIKKPHSNSIKDTSLAKKIARTNVVRFCLLHLSKYRQTKFVRATPLEI